MTAALAYQAALAGAATTVLDPSGPMAALCGLPELAGRPIRVVIRKSLGQHLAATSIPRRIVYLDSEVLVRRGDFERILVHELFHFVWVRLSNQARRNWEELLADELRRRIKGELGWSAEWRKLKLTVADVSSRNRAWRLYACESFCDTAAWCFAGLAGHAEFTLAQTHRRARGVWFHRRLGAGIVLI